MDAYSKHSRYSNHWDYISSFKRSDAGSGTISDSGNQFSADNSLVGFRNPRWRDQVRLGQNATTALTGVMQTGKGSWVSITWDSAYRAHNSAVQTTWHYEFDGHPSYLSGPSAPSPPGSVTTRVTNRCITKFLDACESARSTFEAGQDIGEYKETLESIHHPLHSLQTKLVTYLESLKKAKQKYPSHSLPKVLADTYLEWRFGINPLVSDVAAAIADAGRYRFPTIPVKASASELYAGTNSPIRMNQGYTSIFNPTQNLKSNSKYSVRYKGAIRSGADASGRIGMAQAWQLLPRNFLPTAWDLLPWSWVADYFTNVGDMIRSLSFVSSDLVWACKTIRSTDSKEYGNISLWNVDWLPAGYEWVYRSYSANGGSAKFTYESTSRSVLVSSDLMPRFEFRVPTSKYPYYNLAAVLISRYAKLVPFFK